jgi:hypothetical protein
MRCPPPTSDSSPEIAIPFDVIHPEKWMKLFTSCGTIRLNDLPQRT